MRRGISAIGRRFSAIAGILRSKDLRRLQAGWAAFFLVDGISMVALSVWAFRDDGTSAVGVLGLARLVPGGLALPFGAWAADRFSRRRLVSAVFAAITATQLGIAVALGAEAPRGVIFALVALGSVAAAPYRPAHLALAPLVARTPEELVAINVTAGTVEGLVTFLGPALAALLLLAVEPWFVVGAAALASLGGWVAMAGIEVPTDPSRAMRRAGERPLSALVGGFVELRRNLDLAVIVGCFITQLLVRGFLNVLLVAVSFDLVDMGSSGVGWLAAVMGLGGILGAMIAVTLTGRRRLGRPFAMALVVWGGPIAVIGLVPNPVVAVAAMLTIGLGNAVLDVAGFTLMQRLGMDRSLGRVFGVLFSVGILVAGLSSLAAPALVDWLGLRPMLIAVGLVLPVLSLVLVHRFRSLDSRAEPQPELLALLTGIPLLAPLPPTTLEKLAARSSVSEWSTGDVVVAEGDAADFFYAIADGEVEVSRADRSHGTLGPGDQFGEIALLSGSTRTATVTATCPTRLVSIDGRDFVDALTSSEAAFAAGVRVSDERLGHDRADRYEPPA